jgi:DNA-binding NarL/FixJ family response regulator
LWEGPARPPRDSGLLYFRNNYKKFKKITSFIVNSDDILISEMTRTLLFSDEPILAKGLESTLASVEGFQLTGVCSSTVQLKEILDAGEPDILLIDLTSDVTFSILSELKKASLNAKIVLWVHSISTELALQAMALGVRGILRKTLPSELLIKCLQRVNEGEFWFEKALTDSFLSAKRIALTKREGQLVSLLSQGLKNKEIASMLLISEGTVKVYLSRLFQKVGVKDRFELALYGLKNLTTGHGTLEKAPVSADRSSIPEALPMQDLRALFLEKSSLRMSAPPTRLRNAS